MLERIRDGLQGPWAVIIVALIVVSFVFTGVSSYLGSSASTAVAIVNGEEISQQALEIAVENERAQREERFGEAISSLFANEAFFAEFRQGVLDRLINEALIAQKAKELGLRVSDEQIKEAILQFPNFQVAGQFSNEAYQNSLQRSGYTPSQFAEYVRTQMTREQLRQALLGSTINSEKALALSLRLQQQTRDARYVEVSAENYIDDVEVTDEEIQSFYDSNIQNYDTQERVKLAFISLSADNLMSGVNVTQDEALSYYEENLGYYQTPEVREVAHILFELTGDEAQAREEAQTVLSQLTSGGDFAELASEYSDDIASAEDGGYLGQIERGDFDPQFSDAVFNLQNEGDITDIVETEFGLHIIKLTTLNEAVTTPFEEVQEDITEEVKRDKALDEFYALQSEMERIAFESSESLDEIAQLIERPVLETNFFTENAYPASVNFPEVQNVAFSAELIQDGVNSELLNIGTNEVMVVRVIDHEPQRTKSLNEVSENITAQLKAEKAQQETLVWTQALQEEMMDSQDVSAVLAEKSLSWEVFEALSRQNTDLPRAATDALFALSGDAENASRVVTLNNGNVGLVVLVGVSDLNDVSDEQLAAVAPRYLNETAGKTLDNFVSALRENAQIEFVR